MKRGKRKGSFVFGWLLILAGVLFFTYPYAMIAWNDWHATSQFTAVDWSDAEKAALFESELDRYDDRLRGVDEAVDPFAGDGTKVSDSFFHKMGDETIGFLQIPVLDEVFPVYLGASEEHLGAGACLVEGTPIPRGKVGERPVIAGHRGYYKKLLFRHVDLLRAGDELILVMPEKTYFYEVTDQEVIAPESWERLLPKSGEDMLTLLTCTPYPTADQRLLINAVRVAEVPKTESKEAVARAVQKARPVENTVRWKKRGIFAVAVVGSLLALFALIRLGETLFS